MTFDEAIFCMKQYLPDSDSLECMKCPYYHTVPIEGTENGFTCKADEAHKKAIEALETIPKYKDAYNKGWDDGAKASYEHLKMCEEEQSGDLISRDMALEKMADYVASGYADSVEDFEEYSRIICQLPSVNLQEPKTDVLDKIRAEIEELADADGYGDYQLGFSFGLMMAMEIIDKYRAESEVNT